MAVQKGHHVMYSAISLSCEIHSHVEYIDSQTSVILNKRESNPYCDSLGSGFKSGPDV